MTPSFPAHRSSGRGQGLLQALHLRQESVSIAGGIVLFLIGLRMIFPTGEGLFGDNPEGEPFIVPMAIPLIAGPSGMAAVMLLGRHEPARTLESDRQRVVWGKRVLGRLDHGGLRIIKKKKKKYTTHL